MNTRMSTIVRMLEDSEQVSIRDLAPQFRVSEMTVRRDLDRLQELGIAIRVHGGAISTGRLRFLQSMTTEPGVPSVKALIGRAAVELVVPGQTILIDTGVTALEVARHIPANAEITVATTSLAAAQELHNSNMKVLLLGGFLRKEFPSVYGPLTERMLEEFQVDMLFIGCDAAHRTKGFYSNDLNVSSLERSMVNAAARVVVVTDSSKFGRTAFARHATLDQVHVVVTDTGISAEDKASLERHGISVITVDPASETTR